MKFFVLAVTCTSAYARPNILQNKSLIIRWTTLIFNIKFSNLRMLMLPNSERFGQVVQQRDNYVMHAVTFVFEWMNATSSFPPYPTERFTLSKPQIRSMILNWAISDWRIFGSEIAKGSVRKRVWACVYRLSYLLHKKGQYFFSLATLNLAKLSWHAVNGSCQPINFATVMLFTNRQLHAFYNNTGDSRVRETRQIMKSNIKLLHNFARGKQPSFCLSTENT